MLSNACPWSPGQLLKALKQKLHEKEEVLLGKTQVIDVLQGEVDGRDQQIKVRNDFAAHLNVLSVCACSHMTLACLHPPPQELTERLRRLQVERESLESKMEAEKHVMRAQLRDLMDKQRAEVQRLTEQHQEQMARTQQDLLGQLEEFRRSSTAAAPPGGEEASGNQPVDSASVQRIAELEGGSHDWDHLCHVTAFLPVT